MWLLENVKLWGGLHHVFTGQCWSRLIGSQSPPGPLDRGPCFIYCRSQQTCSAKGQQVNILDSVCHEVTWALCSQRPPGGNQCRIGSCHSGLGLQREQLSRGTKLWKKSSSCQSFPLPSASLVFYRCLTVGSPTSGRESVQCGTPQRTAEPGKCEEGTSEQCLFSPQIKPKFKGK